jgi:PAS domain S-box-containing protein
MFRQLTIHKKLALVLWGAVLMAFVIASAAFLLFENLTLKRRAELTLEPYARLVSVGSETAVAFEDPDRAREILQTLRANPRIVAADIVLENGTPLAGYVLDPGTPVQPFQPRADGVYLERNAAERMQSLPGGARLRLVMDMKEFRRLPEAALWIFSTGLLVLLAITLGQMSVLRRAIVRPISALAEAEEQIRTGGDYARRVPASGTDEVAQLGRNFNAMMEAVEQREHDLRQLNVFHRTILDNAAHGIISTAPDGIVTSFNPAAERLLGYMAGEVVGRQTPVLWHDPHELAQRARQLSRDLGVTVAPGFEVFAARPRRDVPEEGEWTFIRKDGTRVPVLLSVTALRNEHDQITGFVGLANDLTERKRAEEALRNLNQELDQRVKERTAELETKNRELERMNKLFVGRELRMAELKQQIRHQNHDKQGTHQPTDPSS